MINSNSVRDFVEANPRLIKRKSTSNPRLFVLKYREHCFYRGIWNNTLENARGTVVDENYQLVSNPLRKIYNYGIESHAARIGDNEIITAHRKINGFMLAVSHFEGSLLFSTTGSIDSKFVNMGRELLLSRITDVEQQELLDYVVRNNSTLIYECVHPDDPHIIKEEIGTYFLAQRKNEWNAPVIPSDQNNGQHQFGGIVPESIILPFHELKKLSKTVKHEGFVVYTDDGRVTKLKSKYYLVSKFFARASDTKLLLSPPSKGSHPEEFHSLIDDICQNNEMFAKLTEQDRLDYIRTFLSNI